MRLFDSYVIIIWKIGYVLSASLHLNNNCSLGKLYNCTEFYFY